MMHNAK